jgi:hypothetical protein
MGNFLIFLICHQIPQPGLLSEKDYKILKKFLDKEKKANILV